MAGEILANKVSVLTGNGATPTEVFTVIPGVVGVPSIPSFVRDEIEVTALDSAGKEYLAGLGDPGDMTLTINLRQKTTGVGYLAGQEILQTWANDGGLLHNFRISVAAPISITKTVAGFVKSFKEQAPSANSALTAEVVIRLSGGITIA